MIFPNFYLPIPI